MEERLTNVKTILILETATINISIQVLFMLTRLGQPLEKIVQLFVIILACLSTKEQSMTMLLPNMVLIMQPMFAQLKDRLKDLLPVTKTVQPILRIILIQQRLQQNQVTVQQHKQRLTQAVQKEQLVQGTPIFQHGILQKYTRQLEN